MLRTHLIEIDHLVTQAKLGVAQAAHELADVATVNLKFAVLSQDKTLGVMARVNDGSLKFGWKVASRSGGTKLLAVSRHSAREREQVLAAVPGTQANMIVEIIHRKQLIAETWTRVCQIGKKLNGAIRLGAIQPWDETADFRQHPADVPPSGLDAREGGDLAEILEALLARYEHVRTELALEASGLSAYWRWETERTIRGMGGWDPSNSCPVYLRATAIGRFRLEWFSASTVNPGGLGRRKKQTYHRPYRFQTQSPACKNRKKNILADVHHELFGIVDGRRKEVLQAWGSLSELAALTRDLQASKAATGIAWGLIPAERLAKWVFKPHLPASLSADLKIEAIARSAERDTR